MRTNIPLAPYTSIKIGGVAKYFAEADNPIQVQSAFKSAKERQLRFYVIGGGSNLLFSDEGYDGLVLRFIGAKYRIWSEQGRIFAEFNAGFPSHLASVKMLEAGLSGFESMYGLPGSLGGAIYMNSKWPQGHYQTSDNLVSISYLGDDGRIVTKTKPELQFAYGFSSLQMESGIILSAVFSFKSKDKTAVKKNSLAVLSYRQQTQPHGVATAGCIFKNISEELRTKLDLSTTSAGYYIDRCGLKGKQVGQLQISPLHANFFINLGKATARQYQELVNLVKQQVKIRFGIDLREEVLFIE